MPAELETNKAWHKLNEARKRYKSLFHHNSDVIISFDLNCCVTDGNIALESITGYTAMELLGSTLESLIVKEDTNLVKKLFMKVVGGTTEKSRMTILHKMGDSIELSIKVTPLIIDGAVIGIYGILRDITEVEKLVKKYEESEERFQIIAEHAHDLITLLNDKGKIQYVSPSYREILGFDHKEYVGKLFLHNVHPDERLRIGNMVLESIKNGEHFTVQGYYHAKRK